MAVFMVGYDLHTGQNYKDLEDAIMALGSWWHCLDSTWLVVSNLTASQIRDRLRLHIKADDRLLVLLYGKANVAGASGAWFGFNKECSDWLIAQL